MSIIYSLDLSLIIRAALLKLTNNDLIFFTHAQAGTAICWFSWPPKKNIANVSVDYGFWLLIVAAFISTAAREQRVEISATARRKRVRIITIRQYADEPAACKESRGRLLYVYCLQVWGKLFE